MKTNLATIALLALLVPTGCALPGDDDTANDGPVVDGTAANDDDSDASTSNAEANDDGDASTDTNAESTDGGAGSTDGVADETGDASGDSGGDEPDTVIPGEQDPDLLDATTALNESCGTELITTIDWGSFEDNYGLGPLRGWDYTEAEAVSYCVEIIDTIEFDCRQVDGVADAVAAVGLTQLHCYWSDELPYDPGPEIDTRENMLVHITEAGVLTWGMNWWSANTTDQVHGWVDDL